MQQFPNIFEPFNNFDTYFYVYTKNCHRLPLIQCDFFDHFQKKKNSRENYFWIASCHTRLAEFEY